MLCFVVKTNTHIINTINKYNDFVLLRLETYERF